MPVNSVKNRLLHIHYSHILSNKQLLEWLSLDPSLTSWEKSSSPFWPSALKLSSSQKIRLQDYHSSTCIACAINQLKQKQVSFITIFDNHYPPQLKEIYDPPAVIYTKGNVNHLNASYFLGIVGARKADRYTISSLQKIIPPLIDMNICIVSGMAQGADGAAHQLAMNGFTIGVLGAGFDYQYPSTHTKLYEQMIKSQLLISEYPPYLRPDKRFFPSRNRIIAGLSRGVLVTQAALRSGSMITVDRALEEGRDVFALPGPIDHELSQGTNHLIRQGAVLITCAQHIAEEWGIR
ncbi:DNA-protecting protein DprA [Jeotgalibacillus sp. S-D1]|uniref:DNA-processing protein DprA n=1 Tax=Jeotgalibacillus sp. S-D1 TaxID=2552189 RepID=UPI001059E3BB|nr:DNA-processing protein DprA [Jeotgalibacillus sp. S-D1]TDL35055.1 DNA-protecting protein DprA [Jeotgalibacillus sp. S-D1]